jgi:hypothetical protein
VQNFERSSSYSTSSTALPESMNETARPHSRYWKHSSTIAKSKFPTSALDLAEVIFERDG